MTESGRPRVFVTDAFEGLEPRNGPSLFDVLRGIAEVDVWPGPGRPSPEALRERTSRSAGLLCLLTDRIDRDLFEASPMLRIVSTCSVGVDHIDVDAARAHGVEIGHTPGVLAETTAELAFGLLLAAARRIAEGDRWLRSGAWRPEARWAPDMLLGRDLAGATLGVLGLGAIGQAVAARGRAFGMRTIGWTPSGRRVDAVESRSFEQTLAEADFVTVHVAYSERTRGLIDAAALERMRPGAYLVNTARGGIVDESALARALSSGHLAGAALDVFAQEPLERTSPLLALENVVLTPHIGSASLATRRRMARLAVDNLRAGLLGEPLPAAVVLG